MLDNTYTADDVAAFCTVFDAIVREGAQLNPETAKPTGARRRIKQSVSINLLRCFRRYADAILLFISDFSVPFQ